MSNHFLSKCFISIINRKYKWKPADDWMSFQFASCFRYAYCQHLTKKIGFVCLISFCSVELPWGMSFRYFLQRELPFLVRASPDTTSVKVFLANIPQWILRAWKLVRQAAQAFGSLALSHLLAPAPDSGWELGGQGNKSRQVVKINLSIDFNPEPFPVSKCFPADISTHTCTHTHFPTHTYTLAGIDIFLCFNSWILSILVSFWWL